MEVAGWTLRLAVGIVIVVGVLTQGDDRFRDRPILPDYEDGAAPLGPAIAPPDEQYDYDYYDDAQPHPPSKLDTILPLVTFRCRAEGYYADPEFDCEVFHYCSASGTRFTFLCGEGSKFHQKMLICDFDHNLRCGGDGTLQQTPAHADTLSTEHLFPAGEILKVTSSNTEPPNRRRPPPAAPAPARPDRRRPETRPQVFPRPLPARRRQDTLPVYTESETRPLPARRRQDTLPVYTESEARPLPARRRQDTLPVYTESDEESDRRLRPAPEQARRPVRQRVREPVRDPVQEPAREPIRKPIRKLSRDPAQELPRERTQPLDRYQSAAPAPAQRRQGGPEGGYQAVLNDIHGIIRETEAFQLPVLPLLTPAERRQDDGETSEEEDAEPPPRMHVPKQRRPSEASRRRDPYGVRPTQLRRPLLRRRQRSVRWEDHGLLALRDIVDSKVSRFFPNSDAPTAERRSDSSVMQKERDFDTKFFSNLEGFPEDFSAPLWPAPVPNEITAETGSEGRRRGQKARRSRMQSGRSAWARAGEDTSLYKAHELATADFGNKYGRSLDVSEAKKSADEDKTQSETEAPQETAATTEPPQESVTEPLTDLETAATTEVFNAAEYGTPKSSSILSAAETAEQAEPAVAASSQVTARRPRRQQLQRRQLVPRNQGVDQLRQLQRPTFADRPAFAASQPGRPFVNTQFVNVGPSVRRPQPQTGSEDQQRRGTEDDPSVRQSGFGDSQRFQPAEAFSFQPTQVPPPPAFRRPITAGSASTARQSSFRAIDTQPAEQSFIRPQQSFSRPQQSFSQPQQSFSQPQQSFSRPQQSFSQPQSSFLQPQSFSRPVFQDSQRFGAPQPPSVVTVGNLPTSFRPGSTSFSSSPGSNGNFGSTSSSNANFGSISSSNVNFGSSSGPVSPDSRDEPTRDGRPGGAQFRPSDDDRFQSSDEPRFQSSPGAQFQSSPGPQFQRPADVQFGRPTGPPPGFQPQPQQQQQQGFRSGLLPAPNALGFNTFVAPHFASAFQRLPPPPSSGRPGSFQSIGREPASGPARFIPTRPPSQFFTAPQLPTLPPLPTAAPFPFSPRPGPVTTPRPQTAAPTLPPAAFQTTFPAFEGGDFDAPEPGPAVVSLQPFDEEFFGRPTGRPLAEVPQSLADDPPPLETTAPAPHISTPLPEGVIAALAGVTEPTTTLQTEPTEPTRAAPTLSQGRRRFKTRRPGGRRRRPRPTAAPEVTDLEANELTAEGDSVVKDSGFTMSVKEVTSAPQTDSSVAPQRGRRPSRRRLSGRRTTTTAAPATAEPTETDSDATEATPATPVRAFRRRRPTGSEGFRSRPRQRLRTRVRQQDTEKSDEANTGADQTESTSADVAFPAQETTEDTRQVEEEVTPRPSRRRRPGVSAGSRSRRPIRRRNRVRTTSTESPAVEQAAAVDDAEEVATVPEEAAKSEPESVLVTTEPTEPEEEGIRATAADLRQMQEQGAAAAAEKEEEAETPVKTTQQRLQELFERRKKNRLSLRRQRPSRRRRPAAEKGEEPASAAAVAEQEEDAADARSVDARQRRIGSRRLTQPRQRLRVSRPDSEDTKITVQRVQIPTEPPTEQSTEQSTEQAEEPTEQAEELTVRPRRPLRRRFRPDGVRTRQRTRLPLRIGGRVSTLASLLVETSGPTTTPAPATTNLPPTTAPATTASATAATTAELDTAAPATAEPTNVESLTAVNLEGSNMESRGDPPKRTLLGSLRQRDSTAAQVTHTTITPVLAETENPAPRATRPLAAEGAETGRDAGQVTTEPATTQKEREITAAPTTAPSTVTVQQTQTETTVRTTAETTVRATAETTVRTTEKPQTAEATESPELSTTEQPEFIPFDTTEVDVSLDSIIEQVAATEGPTVHPSITMATDSPLLPLQSLFAGF